MSQEVHTLLEIVQGNPKNLKNFRPIIHYLTGTDPSHDRGREECERDGIPMMESLPPMCPSCYDILAELYRLHEQLLNVQLMIQKQTELAREVVTKTNHLPTYSTMSSASTPTPRQRFQCRIQSSSMSPMESKRVISFVDNLHNKIVTEAVSRKKVVFPFLESHHSIPHQPPTSAAPPEVLMPDPLGDDPVLMVPSSSFTPSHVAPTQTLTSSPCPSLSAAQPPTPSTSGLYFGIRHENPQGTEESADFKFEGEGSELENDEDVDFEPELSDLEYMDDEDVKDSDFNVSPDISSPGPSTSDKHLSSSSGSGNKEGRSFRPRILRSSKQGTLKKKTSEGLSAGRSSLPNKKKRPVNRSGRKWKNVPSTRPLVEIRDGISQHCDICGDLVHSSEIENHLVIKHNLKDYVTKCPNPSCLSVFSCLGKLKKHLRAGTVDKNKCFKAAKPPMDINSRTCEVCNFKTSRVPAFREHLLEHETKMEMSPRLACPIPVCIERFALRQSVEDHLCLEHRSEKKKPKRVLVNGVKVLLVQNCDLCEEWILFTEIIQHLEGHNVKEYITKCPNPECEYAFSCVGRLKAHLEERSKCRPEVPGLLKCEACNFEVVSPITFRKHLLVHERLEEKAIFCPIADCSERFALRQSVEAHLMSHGFRHRNKMKNISERTEQKCPMCEEVIKIKELAKHFTEVHKVEETFKCSYCPFLFPNWESFLEHLYEHRSMTKDGLSCHICSDSRIKFYKFGALCQHFFNVHQLGKQYLCEQCDLEFFFHQSLTSHIQKAHSIDNTTNAAKQSQPKPTGKLLKCDKCPDATFKYRNELRTHEMREHGAPPVTCKFCPETFLSIQKLEKHERTHTGLGRSYKCRVEGCDKVYPNMTMWRRHMTNSHNPNPQAPKEFSCNRCDKSFTTKHSLNSHVDRLHLGIKEQRRICDICGESFASASTLKCHKLIHTGERPHKCSICGQGFRHFSALRTHLKAHQEKGESFKPNGPMKNVRKRVAKSND